jgi:hypothetical protein
MTLSNAAKKFPHATWFVWFDSDVYVNPRNAHLSIESQINLTDENILFHTFHESPWGCYPINTGVKIVHRQAMKYEDEMWDLRYTDPWKQFPYDQKALYEYIFPKLDPSQYTINDPHMLNCILHAYPQHVHASLFVHMCGMSEKDRNSHINDVGIDTPTSSKPM